jgi:hypothetical protein
MRSGKMKKGDKVRCIDAKEKGIPIEENNIYTVKSYFKNPLAIEHLTGEAIVKERAQIPGVTLEEVPGYFMITRFEVV